MRGMGKATLAVGREIVEGWEELKGGRGRSLRRSLGRSNLWLTSYSFCDMMMPGPLKLYADRTLCHICRQACLLRYEVN